MTDNLVTIATFSQPFTAHLFRGRLEAEGIEGFLRDEHIVDANWFYLVAVGWVKVLVWRSDLDQALEVHSAVERGEYEEKDWPTVTCPRCDSADVQRRNPLWPTVALVALIVLAALLTLLLWTVTSVPLKAHLSRALFISFVLSQTLFGFFMFFRKRWRCLECSHRWKMR